MNEADIDTYSQEVYRWYTQGRLGAKPYIWFSMHQLEEGLSESLLEKASKAIWWENQLSEGKILEFSDWYYKLYIKPQEIK